MMKQTTGNTYRQRLIRVIDYIYDHLDGDLGVNTLAEIAMMSPYHFHRIYREMTNETVNATVRRLRLQRAAADLIRSEKSLSDIAKTVSYGSLEAFSRAFTKEFGESPSDYRETKKNLTAKSVEKDQPFIAMLTMTKKRIDEMFTVEMIDMNETHLAGYPHQGDYMEIGAVFEKLFVYAGSQGLVNEDTRSFGIYYDDPKSIDEDQLRSMACGTLDPDVELTGENVPERLSIPKGRYATVLFKGSYAELEKPYSWLFGEWFPNSGYEAGDFPPVEEYLNDPKDTPPNELLTRIYCLLA